mmetsp:Transcript_121640/g.305937  ORF Transcript_121640/g.305937 Transcript_121640/m.305937 type:complete len:296 (-) Transcript_121640:115-1002(-)
MAAVMGPTPVLMHIGFVSADSLKHAQAAYVSLLPPVDNNSALDSASLESTPKGQEARESWTLVWCSERCCKPEQEEIRKGLASAARKAGGKLMCVRKAAKFSAWFSAKCRLPLVLVVDWREVKPCMEYLDTVKEAGNGFNSMPAVVVVLAGTPAIFKRASAWAKTRSAEDRMVIVQDFSDVHELMDDITKHTSLDVATCSWLNKLNCKLLDMDRQLDSSTEGSTIASCTPTPVANSPTWPSTTFSSVFLEVAVPAEEEILNDCPCFQIMSEIFPNQDAAQVESKLRQAAPAFYED